MRTFAIVALAWALGTTGLAAERLLARSYDVGLLDLRTAVATVRPLLGPEGTVVDDPRSNRLVVVDIPEVHRRVAAALEAIEVDPRNVRITVTSELERDTRQRGIGASGRGRVGPADVTVGRPSRERGVRITGSDSRTSRTMRTQQTLVTLSGTRASITVADSVPEVDWFRTWGVNQGLWSGEVRWREVGTRMAVEPMVLGDGRVRVRLTPSFEYFAGPERTTTDVTALATEVVVAEGDLVEIGGLPFRDAAFSERFFLGTASSGESQRVSITLRVDVQ